jgi:hypothetical protein
MQKKKGGSLEPSLGVLSQALKKDCTYCAGVEALAEVAPAAFGTLK